MSDFNDDVLRIVRVAPIIIDTAVSSVIDKALKERTMESARKNNEETESFRQMGRDAIEEAGGDHRKAVRILVDRLLTDRDFLERNLPEILLPFAQQQVTLSNSYRRHENPTSMKVVPINGGAFNEAVLANYQRYMSRPIWGGKAIGDCTAAEIRESAERYEKQGSSMLRESAWELSVAQALEKNRKTLEAKAADVLAETDLAILWDANND